MHALDGGAASPDEVAPASDESSPVHANADPPTAPDALVGPHPPSIAELPTYREQAAWYKEAEASNQMKEGDHWYLVAQKWFDGWRRFSRSGGDRPGPIDQSTILDAHTGQLLEGLFEHLEVAYVCEPVWLMLLAWYGLDVDSRPVRRRVSRNSRLNNTLIIAVYKKVVSVFHTSHPSTSVAVRVHIYETMGHVKKLALDALAQSPQITSITPATLPALVDTRLLNGNVVVKESDKFIDIPDTAVFVLDVREPGQEWSTPSLSSTNLAAKSAPVWPARMDTAITTTSTASTNTGTSTALARPKPLYSTAGSGSALGYGASSSSTTSSSGLSSLYGTGTSSYANRTQSPPGVTGLSNLGNTCFMNAALQCLSNTRALRDFFINDTFVEQINRDNVMGTKGELAEAFGELLKRMWTGGYSSVSPSHLKTAIGRKNTAFSGYQQHDSQELLSFVLDTLHEDLNRVLVKPYIEISDSGTRPDAEVAAEQIGAHQKRNDSIICDIFQGFYKSRIVCPDCNRVSVVFDPYSLLSVPLPGLGKTNIQVTLIRRDPMQLPTRFLVQVSTGAGTLRNVYKALESVANVDAERLVCFEEHRGRLCKVFKESESVSDTRETDHLVVVEVEAKPRLPPPVPKSSYSSSGYWSSNYYGGGSSAAVKEEPVVPDDPASLPVVFLSHEFYTTHYSYATYFFPSALSLPRTCSFAEFYQRAYESWAKTMCISPEVEEYLREAGYWVPPWTNDEEPMEEQVEVEEIMAQGCASDTVHYEGSLVDYAVSEADTCAGETQAMDLDDDDDALERAYRESAPAATDDTQSKKMSADGLDENYDNSDDGANISNTTKKNMARVLPPSLTSSLSSVAAAASLATNFTSTATPSNNGAALTSASIEDEIDEDDANHDSLLDTGAASVAVDDYSSAQSSTSMVTVTPPDSPVVGNHASSPSSSRRVDTVPPMRKLLFHIFNDDYSKKKLLATDVVEAKPNSRYMCEWDASLKDKLSALPLPDVVEDASVAEAKARRSSSVSVHDCIERALVEEQLDDDNMWYCSQCKEHRRAFKKFDIWTLPRVLVIALKRFSYSTYRRSKINSPVDFPLRGLDMSRYLSGPRTDAQGRPVPTVYDLQAISNHHGGLGGGHYTACARNGSQWYNFDDSYTTKLSEADVRARDACGAAYVLVYVLRDEEQEAFDRKRGEEEEAEAASVGEDTGRDMDTSDDDDFGDSRNTLHSPQGASTTTTTTATTSSTAASTAVASSPLSSVATGGAPAVHTVPPYEDDDDSDDDDLTHPTLVHFPSANTHGTTTTTTTTTTAPAAPMDTIRATPADDDDDEGIVLIT